LCPRLGRGHNALR